MDDYLQGGHSKNSYFQRRFPVTLLVMELEELRNSWVQLRIQKNAPQWSKFENQLLMVLPLQKEQATAMLSSE